MDIPATELFAHPDEVNVLTRTFSKLLETSGSVEVIVFPYSPSSWTKIWTVSPRRPLLSRPALLPYNYPFTDIVPVEISNLAEKIVTGDWHLAPAFGLMSYTFASTGLLGTVSADIWGPAKNVQLYIKPTTIRCTANGYAVITNRENVQLVTSQFYSFYSSLLQSYVSRGIFPTNQVVEIRCTGLDTPEGLGIPGAEAPTLSALRPVEGRPDLDVAVWIDSLTFTKTPYANEFYEKLEDFMLSSFNEIAVVRPEWSKGWGYTNTSAWKSPDVLGNTIPNIYNPGVNGNGNTWNSAISVFQKYDPKRVFSNRFLDSLLL